MKIVCPHCSQHLEGDDSLAGAIVECPKCGNSFIIPELEPQPLKALLAENASSVSTKPKSTKALWWTFGTLGVVLVGFLTIILISGGKKIVQKSNAYQPEIDPLIQGKEAAEWVDSCDGNPDYKEILRHSNNWIGKQVRVEGKVRWIAYQDDPDMIKQWGKDSIRGFLRLESDPDDLSTEEYWGIAFEVGRSILPSGRILKGDDIVIAGTIKKINHCTGKNGLGVEITWEEPLVLARLVAQEDDFMDVIEELGGGEVSLATEADTEFALSVVNYDMTAVLTLKRIKEGLNLSYFNEKQKSLYLTCIENSFRFDFTKKVNIPDEISWDVKSAWEDYVRTLSPFEERGKFFYEKVALPNWSKTDWEVLESELTVTNERSKKAFVHLMATAAKLTHPKEQR